MKEATFSPTLYNYDSNYKLFWFFLGVPQDETPPTPLETGGGHTTQPVQDRNPSSQHSIYNNYI